MSTYRKKLIEVALPLEEINVASAREKSIRHGHPSTLHLWWARRPLAACRAVLFASIIDDPGEEGVPKELLDEIDVLPLDRKYVHLANEEATAEEQLARRRRYRLFTFIEKLVLWENSNDKDILDTAKRLIHAATGGNPPPVLDPFCGGGSIPLEAQRLGLEAHASDLNPVAVLITKAMIEIPPKFAGMPPINPEARQKLAHSGEWTGAKGLAEDVRFYGQWMRDEAQKRIGHLYPKVKVYRDPKTGRVFGQADVDRMWAEQNTLVDNPSNLFPHPSSLKEEELMVIAWLWARTVPSPDPAARGAHVPLVRSFVLSSKKGKEAWVEPHVDRGSMTYHFEVRSAETHPNGHPPSGTISKRGGRCILTETPITTRDVRKVGKGGNIGARLMAIVAEDRRGRIYLPPDAEQEAIARTCTPIWKPNQELPVEALGFRVQGYGMTQWCDLFTDRQLLTLSTFSQLAQEARAKAREDCQCQGVTSDYADAVATFLALGVGRLTDVQNSLCTWETTKTQVRHLFTRQTIPMVWDFGENNAFAGYAGDYGVSLGNLLRAILQLPGVGQGKVVKQAAQAAVQGHPGHVVSTDPPYYDNVAYADLSDFFYVWLREILSDVYPELFNTVLVPKSDELVSDPFRHGGQNAAKQFFEDGMRTVFGGIRHFARAEIPVTIFYAFKQSESDEGDPDATRTSTGWETMLEALSGQGLCVAATWPMRSELANRMRGQESNALASCIVLVCRARLESAPSITRRGFQTALKTELPDALRKLTQGNLAPVDLAQAAIGPGMAVFSQYASVLESDGKPMPVRTALQLINQSLDEVLEEQEGWYDPQTRWAVLWFRQRQFAEGPYGEAETLAVAKDSPVNTMVEAGIIRSGQGRVKLLSRDELPSPYDPAEDPRTTIWETTQFLARALDAEGIDAAARMMRRFRESKPDLDIERARDLAYRLYTICDQKRWTTEARVYNALVLSWTDIEAKTETPESEWGVVAAGPQAQLDV